MSGEKLPDRAPRTTALTSADRSFLVEAGAGSGKTLTVASNIAYLIDQGAKTENILALAFNQKAG